MLNFLAALGLSLSLLPGTSPDVAAVVAGNNRFALDLYGHLSNRGGNLFFSPYSISKTLAMTYAGARGETEREMAAVLHFTAGQQRQHLAFRDMRTLLIRNLAGSAANPLRQRKGVQLLLSANLWGQRGYSFQTSFLSVLHDCYGAELQTVDFAHSDQARKTINDWVERQTNHKIQELFAPGHLNLNTRLVLASAIYFKGGWLHPFSKSDTRREPFTLHDSRKLAVPMMNQTETFGYFENEQVQVLQLPYEGKSLAMVVLLPRRTNGLADLEKTLTAEKLASWCGQIREQQVKVTLPKFRLNDAFLLKETLEALGMKKAFSPSEADFRGMDGGRDRLFISVVTHKAFVETGEEGTEAAAATGVAVGALSAPPMPSAPPPVFRADHPFLFAIREVDTGLVMFLGRVVQP